MILAIFERARDATPHAVFDVRRVIRPPAPGMRSTVKVATGTRAVMVDHLHRAAAARGVAADTDATTTRATLLARPASGPGGERVLAVAPAWVAAKQRPGFDTAWQRVTGPQADLFTEAAG